MPYVSRAQQGYFNTHRSEIGGKVVDEFNRASRGRKLPKRAKKRGKRKSKKRSRRA